MDLAQLETEINAAWDNRDAVNASIRGIYRLSLIHISGPRDATLSRMPSSA